MNNNIFENAKFGDKFVTRDGRVALYLNSFEYNPEELDNIPNIILYELIASDNLIITVNSEGIDNFIDNIECNNDIVYRYKEPIDEDKLNELAYNFTNSREKNEGQDLINKCRFEERIAKLPENIMYYVDLACIFFEGFKSGYKKAKEG